MATFLLYLQIVMFLIPGMMGDWPGVVNRANVGVQFDLDRRVLVAPETYRTLVLILKFPSLDGYLLQSLISPCEADQAARLNHSLCPRIDEFVRLENEVIHKAQQRLLRADQTLKALLSHPVSVREARKTRGAPLGFIGSLSRSIFGTATINDVLALQAKVDALHREMLSDKTQLQNGTVKLIKHTMQGFDAISDRLGSVERNMARTAINFRKIESTMSSIQKNITSELAWGNFLLLHISYSQLKLSTILQYEQHWTKWISGIEQLQQGQVPANLIPAHEVLSGLNNVDKNIADSGLKLCMKNLDFLYNDHLSAFLYSHSHLYIHLSLPLTRGDCTFMVYSLTSWPIPLTVNQSMGYTEVGNLPRKIALSSSAQQYALLTSEDLDRCMPGHYLQCPHGLTLLDRTYVTCASAIWNDVDASTIHEKCHYTISPRLKFPTITKLIEQSRFIIASPSSEISFYNQEGFIKSQQCTYCVITIPCGQYIRVSNRTIYSVDKCISSVSVPIELVNLPLLGAFNISLGEVSAGISVGKSVNLIIPNMSTIVNSVPKYAEAKINLKQLAIDLREHQENTWVTSLVDDDLPRWFGFSSLISTKVVTGILFGISMVPGIYAVYKYRQLMPLLMAHHHFLKTQAAPAHDALEVNLLPKPTIASLDSRESEHYFYELMNKLSYTDTVLTLILMTIALMLVWKLVNRLFKRFFLCIKGNICHSFGYDVLDEPEEETTNVYFRIGTPDRNCSVKVLSLLDIPSALTFRSLPRFSNLYLESGCIRDTLHMEVNGTFTHCIGNTIRTCTPPRCIKISKTFSKKLGRVLQNQNRGSFDAYFYIVDRNESKQIVIQEGPCEPDTPVSPPEYGASAAPIYPLLTEPPYSTSSSGGIVSDTPMVKKKRSGRKLYRSPSWLFSLGKFLFAIYIYIK